MLMLTKAKYHNSSHGFLAEPGVLDNRIKGSSLQSKVLAFDGYSRHQRPQNRMRTPGSSTTHIVCTSMLGQACLE